MTRVKAVVLDGPASAATIAAIRAELDAQTDVIVVASVSIREIAERVCFETGVALRELLSKRQDRQAFRARAAVCWLARALTAKSLPQIGSALDRDHSTVILALRRAETMRARDPAFRRLTDRVAAELDGGAA